MGSLWLFQVPTDEKIVRGCDNRCRAGLKGDEIEIYIVKNSYELGEKEDKKIAK